MLRVLKLYYKVASSQLPAPQIAPRTKVVLPSHQFSCSSSPDTPRTKVALQSRQCSPAFRALDTHVTATFRELAINRFKTSEHSSISSISPKGPQCAKVLQFLQIDLGTFKTAAREANLVKCQTNYEPIDSCECLSFFAGASVICSKYITYCLASSAWTNQSTKEIADEELI